MALDYLWRCGVLHVVARRNFQKVYDFSERAVPGHAAAPVPGEAAHVDWACRTALERLGTATPRRAGAVLGGGVEAPGGGVARRRRGVGRGETRDGGIGGRVAAGRGVRVRRIAGRVARLPEPPDGIRLLCPFDPVLRDRARAKRLFDFDFRFEGFVPSAKRTHGYYVMAMLEGDRFVGKADPKFDRAAGVLTVRQTWWGRGVKVTSRRAAAYRGRPTARAMGRGEIRADRRVAPARMETSRLARRRLPGGIEQSLVPREHLRIVRVRGEVVVLAGVGRHVEQLHQPEAAPVHEMILLGLDRPGDDLLPVLASSGNDAQRRPVPRRGRVVQQRRRLAPWA